MMTGRKDTKVEKSSSQRSGGSNGGGGINVSETGALFPRLHVKETNRVGPRAPPRNKMALYEQFTFPSSRFMPPSLPLPTSGRTAATPAPTTTYGSQRSSYEGSLFYGLPPSLSGMPWMPYAAVNKASPSVNGSSNSTVVDCEKELQQRPAVPETTTRPPSSAVGQGSSWVPSQSNVSSVSCKRSRSNDDCTVPTLTPLSSSYGPSVPTVRTHQHAWQAWPQRSTDTSNTCQQVSVSSGCQVESSGLASLRTNRGTYPVSVAGRADGEATRGASWKTEKKAQVEEESELRECTNDEIEKDCGQIRSSDAEVSESHRHASRRHRHHRQEALQSEADNCPSKGSKSCAIVSGESLAGPGNDGKGGSPQTKLSAIVERSADLSAKVGEVLKGDVEKEMKEKPCSDARGRRKRGNPSECKSSSFAGGDDEVEIISTAKASEPSQLDAWSDGAESDSSMLGNQEAPRKFRKISSRHMINIIGEQEFWRTRKLLQRQQKIISEQVFELHRLIKVQQLLASSADVLMGEGMLGDCDEVAEDSLEPAHAHEAHTADDEDDEEDDAHDSGAGGGDQEGPESAIGKHPDSTCHSSTSPPVCTENPVANPVAASDHQKLEDVPVVPSITPGESSASWAGSPFPKAGVNNWFGAVPAPNGAYVYQPYPGPFHPPAAHAMGGYNGAYSPVMCAPGPMDVPSLNPYCMPRFEQPDLMQDMYRYNTYAQQWPPAMLYQPVGSNPSASWYGVPPPIPFLDPSLRGPYGWYEDVASGAQAAGPKYLRPPHQSSAHGMPVPRHPAFVVQPPWTEVSNSQQTGNDGGGFRHQAPWARLGEPGQTAPPASQRPSSNPSCQEDGKAVSPQSDACIDRPPHSSGHNNTTGSGVLKGVAGTDHGWEQSEENICYDQGRRTPEISAEDYNISVDKLEEMASKRGKVSRQETREPGDADESGQNVEATMPLDCGRALPLFPLGPALNVGENRKLPSQSSGVIKAVPRAMVATAESAAEILLSIQKQRQQ